MKITDFQTMNMYGDSIQADAHGNNIAFNCFVCSHPVLATTRDKHRGNNKEHPSTCKSCGQNYFLDVREKMEKLDIYEL